MKVVNQWLPELDLKKLDAMVTAGFYPNRAEAIRFAIHDFIRAFEKLGYTFVNGKWEKQEGGTQ